MAITPCTAALRARRRHISADRVRARKEKGREHAIISSKVAPKPVNVLAGRRDRAHAACPKAVVATVERDFFTNVRPSSLLQRFTSPDEVAAMIVYVCSAIASATNGAALRMDGGVVRAIS